MEEKKSTSVRLRRNDRIAEIIAVAREVVTENNGVEMPIGEIASRLGIVEGAIYRLYPTKKHLVMAVLCDWYEEVMSSYEDGLEKISGVREQLGFVTRHHIDCIYHYPELVNFYFGVVRMSREYWGSELHKLNKRYTNRVVKILAEGALRGELRADKSPRLGRDILFGVVEQSTWPFRMKVGTLNPEELAENISDLIYNAFVRPVEVPTHQQELADRLLGISEELRSLASGNRS